MALKRSSVRFPTQWFSTTPRLGPSRIAERRAASERRGQSRRAKIILASKRAIPRRNLAREITQRRSANGRIEYKMRSPTWDGADLATTALPANEVR
ncbi:MAG: hypothetical protein FD148_1578 [Methylocystaceae bacterium]|nr:MAG: hypothetical protein FD148_1578 [Methylocystaceae bacterium]